MKNTLFIYATYQNLYGSFTNTSNNTISHTQSHYPLYANTSSNNTSFYMKYLTALKFKNKIKNIFTSNKTRNQIPNMTDLNKITPYE